MRIFSGMNVPRWVYGASLVAGLGLSSYLGLSGFEAALAFFIPPGLVAIGGNMSNFFGRVLRGEQNVPTPAGSTEMGDVETLLASLAGVVATAKFQNDPTRIDLALAATAAPGLLLTCKSVINGLQTVTGSAQQRPEPARRQANRPY